MGGCDEDTKQRSHPRSCCQYQSKKVHHHQHHRILFLVVFVRKSSKEKVCSSIDKILKTLTIKPLVSQKLLVKFKCKNCQVEAAPADKEAREDFNKFVREILDQNTNHGGQTCSGSQIQQISDSSLICQEFTTEGFSPELL